MAEPKFEEYTPPEITLKNGKTFVVKDLLEQARRQYRKTRTLYNLCNKTKQNKARMVSVPKHLERGPGRNLPPERRTSHKYSYEDAIWIVNHPPQEIVDRYRVTLTQSYAIRHYCRQLLSDGVLVAPEDQSNINN